MVVEELSIALFQSMTDRPETPTGTSELRAEELLRETYCQPWSLSDVARSVGVHPAHLGRSFRARFGCTVGEFVRYLRVLHVARELRDTEKPIAQIAVEAGFADQSHCTRVFHKLIAETPARFRAHV
jgi:AraC family transcriptional regulator